MSSGPNRSGTGEDRAAGRRGPARSSRGRPPARMSWRTCRLVLAVALAWTAWAERPSPAMAGSWRTYANARYGFLVSYPAWLLRPLPPPTNGDGRTFATADGAAQMLVWAAPAREALRRALRTTRAEYAREGRITYVRRGGDWFVLSGYLNTGEIFYRRSRFVCGGGLRLDVELRYPPARRGRWDPLVGRITRSLRMRRGGCRAFR